MTAETRKGFIDLLLKTNWTYRAEPDIEAYTAGQSSVYRAEHEYKRLRMEHPESREEIDNIWRDYGLHRHH